MGSALNKPTIDGMLKIINEWWTTPDSNNSLELRVAGYGTEQLHGQYANKGNVVKLLGPLSETQLYNLLETTKACLCFQFKGSGTLTRIVEMLIANVPVAANIQAARTYYNMQGILEFNDIESLKRVLSTNDCICETIPIPNAPESDRLNNFIDNIAMNTSSL